MSLCIVHILAENINPFNHISSKNPLKLIRNTKIHKNHTKNTQKFLIVVYE